MDPLFIATPPEAALSSALEMWPELAGKKLRPLLITAFGDIHVEVQTGEVLLVDPIAMSCTRVGDSVPELEALFADQKWAHTRLMTELIFLAKERGVSRQPHQVFAISPHPCLTGEIRVEHLMPMDINMWHGICAQLRNNK